MKDYVSIYRWRCCPLLPGHPYNVQVWRNWQCQDSQEFEDLTTARTYARSFNLPVIEDETL